MSVKNIYIVWCSREVFRVTFSGHGRRYDLRRFTLSLMILDDAYDSRKGSLRNFFIIHLSVGACRHGPDPVVLANDPRSPFSSG